MINYSRHKIILPWKFHKVSIIPTVLVSINKNAFKGNSNTWWIFHRKTPQSLYNTLVRVQSRNSVISISSSFPYTVHNHYLEGGKKWQSCSPCKCIRSPVISYNQDKWSLQICISVHSWLEILLVDSSQ